MVSHNTVRSAYENYHLENMWSPNHINYYHFCTKAARVIAKKTEVQEGAIKKSKKIERQKSEGQIMVAKDLGKNPR